MRKPFWGGTGGGRASTCLVLALQDLTNVRLSRCTYVCIRMHINIDIFYRGLTKAFPVTMNYRISPTVIALTFRNFTEFKTRELKRPLGNHLSKKSS